jgi:hypothetical protein
LAVAFFATGPLGAAGGGSECLKRPVAICASNPCRAVISTFSSEK